MKLIGKAGTKESRAPGSKAMSHMTTLTATVRCLTIPSFSFDHHVRIPDIGANLTDPVFRGRYRGKQGHPDDFDQMLERAKRANVSDIIVTGGSLTESREAVKLAGNYPGFLYCTVGCHPTRCLEFEQRGDPDQYYADLLATVNADAARGVVVAVGECGLDYDRLQFCPKEVQLKYFEKQFDLAERTGLPMFLHNRNTGSDFVDLMRRNRPRVSNGVVHSFTGTLAELRELLALDLYIGINGCSMKTADNIEVMRAVPIDRLMLETDAPWCDIRPTHASYPYLTRPLGPDAEDWEPATFESKKKERFVDGAMVKGRNEPCTMQDVLRVVAAARQIPVAELAGQVYRNTCRVFFPKRNLD
ncbi:hypothetical protein IWQ60_006897 [Tieghemiomyces parasiticus]|uniref:Uncharacterized protein n=1 Tax=Tieghemiomyces parasiticus TaxID=78921 RepID=A0A9W8DSC6_9FUNG|nr:hypothetical protein IWQ60_006897 [Tieghemiomyces parasiticus]